MVIKLQPTEASRVDLGTNVGDDKLYFDKFLVGTTFATFLIASVVESGSGGTLDVGRSHAGSLDIVLRDTILDKELLDGPGTPGHRIKR